MRFSAHPVLLDEGLSLIIGDRVAHLTPAQGFGLAQKLIRQSTRAVIAEETTKSGTVKRGDVCRRAK